MNCFHFTINTADGIYIVFTDNGILSSVETPSASIFRMAEEPHADTEMTEWLKQQGVDLDTIHKVTLCGGDSGRYVVTPLIHSSTHLFILFSSRPLI